MTEGWVLVPVELLVMGVVVFLAAGTVEADEDEAVLDSLVLPPALVVVVLTKGFRVVEDAGFPVVVLGANVLGVVTGTMTDVVAGLILSVVEPVRVAMVLTVVDVFDASS